MLGSDVNIGISIHFNAYFRQIFHNTTFRYLILGRLTPSYYSLVFVVC